MHKTYLSRKESIIITAIQIIDELGIEGLSTREIARREGMAESTLYGQFKSKQEIVLAIIGQYSVYDISLINTIRNSDINSKDSIIFFIKSIAEYYENYPDIANIINPFELLKNNEIVFQKAKEVFDVRTSFVKELIESGQRSGLFRIGYNSDDLADTIIGLTRYITLKWRIQKYNFLLSGRIMSALESLLELVENPSAKYISSLEPT